MLLGGASFSLKGQQPPVRMNVLPEGYYRATVEGGDTMAVIRLRSLYVFPKPRFRNKREAARYWKLVRDVKKTLPYAKMVYNTLIETYEYIETMPNEADQQAHLKRMEKELFAEYKPQRQVVDKAHRPRVQPIELSTGQSFPRTFPSGILEPLCWHVWCQPQDGI